MICTVSNNLRINSGASECFHFHGFRIFDIMIGLHNIGSAF